MNSIFKIFFIAVLFVLYLSCKKDNAIAVTHKKTEAEILNEYLKIPNTPFNYASPNLPAYFDNQFVKIQNNTPADNKTTDWGATLGRVLFYDTRLSQNHTISCSSCHQQQFGFTDTAQFSKGFKGGLTRRHSMSLINATYYNNGRFFWDERANSLEDQVLRPVQDVVEMGMTLDTLVNRIMQTEFYPILFKYAFGNSTVTSENIAKALAQFVRSMVSYRSKYDEGLILSANRLADFPNYTAEENQGKTIFMTHTPMSCFSCHGLDVFISDNPRNNGLYINNPDSGVFVHTQDPLDIGKFKTPSIKNIALRGRYMHDGSIIGLPAVLGHYNFGIKPNPNLDPHLKDGNGNPISFNLSSSDINAVIAFLETLTDKKIILDEKFSSPFN